MVSDLLEKRLEIPTKLAIIVDGSSVYDQTRLIDFDALYKGIKSKRLLTKAIYYVTCHPNKDMTKFSAMLTACGYEINYKVSPLRTAQDINIVIDSIGLANKVDTIAFVSNRKSSFVELARKLIDMGVVVENWSYLDLTDEKANVINSPYSYIYDLGKFTKQSEKAPTI